MLDYEANCQGTERLKETLPEFIRILREADAITLGIARLGKPEKLTYRIVGD